MNLRRCDVLIFVLEDNDERAKWFMEAFKDHKLVLANHVDVAMPILDTIKFDVLFLDHDLGNKAYVPVTEHNTGSTIANMLRTSANKATPVVVHSWNCPAAKFMLELLRSHQHGAEVHHVLFGQFTKNILYNPIQDEGTVPIV